MQVTSKMSKATHFAYLLVGNVLFVYRVAYFPSLELKMDVYQVIFRVSGMMKRK